MFNTKCLMESKRRSKSRRQARKPKQSKSRRRPKSTTRSRRPNNKSLTAPVSVTRSMMNSGPQFARSSGGAVVIKHREYVDRVQSSATSGGTSIIAYEINPGMSTSFPWLSTVAQNFETYNFRALRFTYNPVSATNVGGSVLLAIDYDASDAPPVTYQQAFSMQESVRQNVWAPIEHTCRKDNLLKRLNRYVRTGNVPLSGDPNLYDTGNMYMISQGVTSTNIMIGELMVEYIVELRTPQPGAGILPIVGGRWSGAGTLTDTNPFGTAPTSNSGTSGYKVNGSSTVTITNQGWYVLYIRLTGTSVTGPAVVSIVSAGMNFFSYQATFSSTGTNTTIVVQCLQDDTAFVVSAPAATITASVIILSSIPAFSA